MRQTEDAGRRGTGEGRRRRAWHGCGGACAGGAGAVPERAQRGVRQTDQVRRGGGDDGGSELRGTREATDNARYSTGWVFRLISPSITIISQKLNQFSSPWSSYTIQLEKPSVTVEYKCEALLQPSNTRISMKLRLLKDSSPNITRSRRDLRPREGGDTRRQLPQVLDQRQALPR